MNQMCPRISIITPSFQQAPYLEQTIDSVLSQGYSNLEYIVIDGGSTDGSADIIKRFEKHLAYWVSEKDRGQTHAINKGLQRATGQVWSFLNSDDLLKPGSLHAVGNEFASNPELEWLAGGTSVFGENVEDWVLRPSGWSNRRHLITPWDRPEKYIFPCSVACFMSRRLLSRCGLFDESYSYCMDGEYYIRAALVFGFVQRCSEQILGSWRWHANSKTWNAGCGYAFREESIRMANAYVRFLPKEDQRILRNQLRSERKGLVSRKAMWLLKQGQRAGALSQLATGLMRSPTLVFDRPWLGAVRRALCPGATP
jgi:glycosyltransferase involved in cell wall biosynthesis